MTSWHHPVTNIKSDLHHFAFQIKIKPRQTLYEEIYVTFPRRLKQNSTTHLHELRKLIQDLRVTENKPWLVNLQCVVYELTSQTKSAVLEITVGHRTLSDQISKLSDQFHHMVGHDVRTRESYYNFEGKVLCYLWNVIN